MKNKLIMKYPSTWHQEMWREAAPCGNGLIGLSVYGGIKKEIILMNHAYLWRGSLTEELPDVSESLKTTRKFLKENDVLNADKVLSDALNKKDYKGETAVPLPLADISIYSHSNQLPKNYRRIIDMEKALVTVTWTENSVRYKRETFVSRINDLVFTRITCDEKILDLNVGVLHHDDETIGKYEIINEEIKNSDNHIFFSAYNDDDFAKGDYGAVCKVTSNGDAVAVTRFERKYEKKEISIKNANEILLVTRLFIKSNREDEFKEISETYDFDTELAKHASAHNEIYSSVDFSISDETETSNEELLIQAYDTGATNELIEKLYAYGRYLFVCSSRNKDTLPCHLVGLWNGSYDCMWAFYMYNVNFELMYWQALTGNMPDYLKLALSYTESQMADFEENAKKLYGCRGIFINSVNTPESGLSKFNGNHILNWTMSAAWFSQHFWDYYMYTGDIEYLKEHSLPFMCKTALFFEDFLELDDNGHYLFSPSVSPENTASNIKSIVHREIETCVNATMDIAVLKELLTNLIKGAKITGEYTDKIQTWENMIAKLPEYQINEDGAIKEWTHEFYKDNYNHRHHSHIYPVFPGREVKRGDELFPAFKKAEDMRLQFGLSDQSSWSMIFMACISARMANGERCLEILDTMARNCLMNNFFTLHNDWRRTGPVFCDDMRQAPFQMDGNLGIPAAINEMMLYSDEDHIEVLPALPKEWKSGYIKGLLSFYGIVCDVEWDEKTVTLTTNATVDMQRKIVYKNQSKTVKSIKNKNIITFERGE